MLGVFLRVSTPGGFTVFCMVFIELFGAIWAFEFVAFARNGNE